MKNLLIASPVFLGSCKCTESGYFMTERLFKGIAGTICPVIGPGLICMAEESGLSDLNYIC